MGSLSRHRQVFETQNRRVVAARWKAIQRDIKNLGDEATDRTLDAIGDRLALLKQIKLITPEPAELPRQVSRDLDSARERAQAGRWRKLEADIRRLPMHPAMDALDAVKVRVRMLTEASKKYPGLATAMKPPRP